MSSGYVGGRDSRCSGPAKHKKRKARGFGAVSFTWGNEVRWAVAFTQHVAAVSRKRQPSPECPDTQQVDNVAKNYNALN